MTAVEEADHVASIMKRSKRPTFVESSDSEESNASTVQLNAIRSVKKERGDDHSQSCIAHDMVTSIDDQRIRQRMHMLHEEGFPAMRSLKIGFQKRLLRRQIGICEVFPRWFTLKSTICCWEDCKKIMEFLEGEYGGEWAMESQKFVADQPLPCDNLSPLLQNMKSKDFMHVALYYTLKSNNKCDFKDLNTCKSCISDKYRCALDDDTLQKQNQPY